MHKQSAWHIEAAPLEPVKGAVPARALQPSPYDPAAMARLAREVVEREREALECEREQEELHRETFSLLQEIHELVELEKLGELERLGLPEQGYPDHPDGQAWRVRAETMMDEDPIEVEIDEDDDEWISDPWNEPEEYEVLEQVAAWHGARWKNGR